MAKKKKAEQLILYKGRKIEFKKFLGILMGSFSDFKNNLFKYKVFSVITFLLFITYQYTTSAIGETTFFYEGLDFDSMAYYNDAAAFFAYLINPIFYFLLFLNFFTFFSMRYKFNSKIVKYVIFLDPKFYFNNILFVCLMFVFGWLYFALFYKNLDFVAIISTINELGFYNAIVAVINENSALFIFSIVFPVVIFFIILFSLFYLYIIYYYNSYCYGRPLTDSILMSIKFNLKNYHYIIFFNFFHIGMFALFVYVFNQIESVILYSLLAFSFYYYNLTLITKICENSVVKFKQ